MTTRGQPFQKGNKANPAGRPRGSRSWATTALEGILAGDAEEIVRKAAELAKGGDAVALRPWT